MSRKVVDPSGHEWRVWREWVEVPAWRRWRRRRGIADNLLDGMSFATDISVGDGIAGIVVSLVVSILLVVVVVLVGLLLFDVLGIVIPFALAVLAADVELIRRLLKRAPFSVEAASTLEHVQFPVYRIRASRHAMRELETSIATGFGPTLRLDSTHPGTT